MQTGHINRTSIESHSRFQCPGETLMADVFPGELRLNRVKRRMPHVVLQNSTSAPTASLYHSTAWAKKLARLFMPRSEPQGRFEAASFRRPSQSIGPTWAFRVAQRAKGACLPRRRGRD